VKLTGPFRNARFSRAVASLLIRRKADWDLLHVHQPPPASIAAAEVARVLGKPVVTTVHSTPREDPTVASAVERTAQRLLPAVCSDIAFVSSYTRQAFGADGEVIHNGIDVRQVQATIGTREAIRKSLNLEGFVVLFSGRRAESKGYRDLLDAIRRAREARADVRLLTIGDETAEDRAAAAPRLRDLGAKGVVTDLGPRDDSVRYFSAADALALPSYREGLPIVLLEGLAAGLPILAARVGGIPEVVEEGRQGFLVEPGDVAAITDRMLRLARAPEFAATLAGNAAKRANDFPLSHTVDAYLQLYDRAMHRPSVGDRR